VTELGALSAKGDGGVAWGDGGGGSDNEEGHTPGLGNGQDTSNRFGTILRYNADTPGELTIPESNPFTGDSEILDEIFEMRVFH